MKTIIRMLIIAALALPLAAPAQAADKNAERDYEIALTKGQYEIELENYKAAIEYLEQALKIKPGDQEARLSLGIALERAGQLARAREVLQQAADADQKDARVRYELALVMKKLGDAEGSRSVMEQALALSRDDALTSAAEGFLSGGGPSGRPSLRLAAGIQYDSNVILEQDDPVAPSTGKKADWRAVFIVNGLLPFLTTETRGAEAGYQFYQSLHRDLEDFNVHQHTARLGGHAMFSRNTRFDLDYFFVYSFVGGEHYSTVNRIQPRVTTSLAQGSFTELRGSYEDKQFFNTPVFTALTEKNGTNAAIGVTHTVKVGAKTGISVNYTYDQDATDRDYWDYTGHKVSVNGLLERGAYTLFLGASYYDRRYDGIPPGASEKRHDGTQELAVSVSRKAGRSVKLSLSDTYTFNDSNLSLYEYKRNILGFFVEMTL